MTQAEIRKVKVGLADLFKANINSIVREFKLGIDDWEHWQVFERAYKEALHLLRLHVVKTFKSNEKTIYDIRKFNRRMQKTRAEQREELLAKQDIQRRLRKLRPKQEQFEKYQEESPAARRKPVKMVAELDQFFKLILPEARGEILGEKSSEEIEEELKSTEECRTRVIDWLAARIADEIAEGFKGVAPKLQAPKIQDTYRISKSEAMKRYINKRESPPYPIGEVEVYEYFKKA
jgi:hypothetical protein